MLLLTIVAIIIKLFKTFASQNQLKAVKLHNRLPAAIVTLTNRTDAKRLLVYRAAGKLSKLFMHGMLGQAPPIFSDFANFFRRGSSSTQAPQHQQQATPSVTDNLLTGADGSGAGFDEMSGRTPPPTLPLPWDAFGETEPPDQPIKM